LKKSLESHKPSGVGSGVLLLSTLGRSGQYRMFSSHAFGAGCSVPCRDEVRGIHEFTLSKGDRGRERKKRGVFSGGGYCFNGHFQI